MTFPQDTSLNLLNPTAGSSSYSKYASLATNLTSENLDVESNDKQQGITQA